MSIEIITDSASDVPRWVIEEYNLKVIPTPVVIEEKDYFDGETIMPSQFYQILREGKEVKTYHINAHMFKESFEPYAKRKDSLIYVCFSTGIAGTFNAAHIAKAELLETYPDFDLTILDSKCASLGFGLAVNRALQLKKEGKDKETIINAIEFYCEHMEHYFTVETLQYLYKGGRLSKTSFIAGGILDIKPIIKIDEKGSLVAIEKVRGRHKSLKRLVEYVGEKGADLASQTIGLVHGDDKETLDTVRQMLMDKYGCTKFIENYVGCAIGAHTGPGIIGILFLNTKEERWM